jgi:hypothetical protein
MTDVRSNYSITDAVRSYLSREQVVDRLTALLRRHVRAEDGVGSDDNLVRVVMARYEHERKQPIVDVNE